jgi:hypothetical protein
VARARRSLCAEAARVAGRIAAALGVVAAVIAAGAVLYFTFPLMHARLDQLVTQTGERTRPIMWRGAWRIFEAHPMFGGGAGAFDALFEPYRPVGYRDQPYYAHCDYLNTLADYGLTGFILLFGAVAAVAWRCARARGLAGAAFTGLLAFALHLLVDFHMKIPALAMIVATVAALVTQEAWPAAPARVRAAGLPARALALVGACAVLALAGTWAVPNTGPRRRAGRPASRSTSWPSPAPTSAPSRRSSRRSGPGSRTRSRPIR